MSKFCRKREHLHNALQRDGWILPSVNAAICTTEWLMKVRGGEIFCIHNKEQFVSKKCWTPPPREVLQKKLEEAIFDLERNKKFAENAIPKVHNLIGSLRLRPANVDFYIVLLSYFKANDEIFEKDYKYSRAKATSGPVLNNMDGLFTKLPPLTEREMRKTNRMRLPKELTLAVKMTKLAEREAAMIKYRQELE